MRRPWYDARVRRSPRLTVAATAASLLGAAAILGVVVLANLTGPGRKSQGDPERDVVVDMRTCAAASARLRLSQGTERVDVLGSGSGGCQVQLTVTVAGTERRYACVFPSRMGRVLVATNRPDFQTDLDPAIIRLEASALPQYCALQ